MYSVSSLLVRSANGQFLLVCTDSSKVEITDFALKIEGHLAFLTAVFARRRGIAVPVSLQQSAISPTSMYFTPDATAFSLSATYQFASPLFVIYIPGTCYRILLSCEDH